VTGGGVSDSDMPSLPWTARQDVSAVEDTSLAALLAGSGLPTGADAELWPVADVLAALTAAPAGNEMTGLAAAQTEFHRHVVPPVQGRHSLRRRPGGLASRLGVKAGAAVAVVVMSLGGAAAAAYAGALPGSWQQFAHRTIGAPAHGADHDTPAGTGAAGSAADRPCAAHQRAPAYGTARCAAVPNSRHPAYRGYPGGSPARRWSPRYTWPPHHAGPPAVRSYAHRDEPPGERPFRAQHSRTASAGRS
jgi:hypothetical protein